MLKEFPSYKINGTKIALFFLLRAAAHHSFTFNLRWAKAQVSVKLFVVFSTFDFVSFLFKFIFLVNKNAWAFWLQNIIIPFKIKIIEKPRMVLSPHLWFLSCNKKFENSMISAWVGAPQKLTWLHIF